MTQEDLGQSFSATSLAQATGTIATYITHFNSLIKHDSYYYNGTEAAIMCNL